jgi:hypothetical protein
MDVFSTTQEMTFSPRVTSPMTKVKRLLSTHPTYRVVPRSFLRGCFKTGKPMTDSPTGFKLSRSEVYVKDLGTIKLQTPIDRVMGLQRLGFSPYNGGEVHIYASLIQKTKRMPQKRPEATSIYELKKIDPVVYFLLVNQVPPGEEFWRKHAALNYVRDNPGITRKEVEKLGLKSERDWDLLVDFQDGMQEWLRAVSKPPECDILSKGQMIQRQKKELRMPDSITSGDVDSGNLKGQSYESQIHAALNNDRYSFFV